jgi:EAL domain-containing protein (putative c-di-GMP-specific phosphodiesterase class I)
MNWRGIMPLLSLVEYFNDRLGQEHRSSFRPFVLEDGKVSGLFGPIRIDSYYDPLRQTLEPTQIVGHVAHISVAPNKTKHLYANEIETLLANNTVPAADFESIINFDRLSRTVHMLNYLVLAPIQSVLFLEVDPRHILGIKQDHGAYFEDVITQCGLETKNIVIVLAVNSQYATYYQELMRGLENYHRRGYQIALKFEYLGQESETTDLIHKISPNYVSLSARNLEDQEHSAELLTRLKQLSAQVTALGGQSILKQIDDKKSDLLARNTGFDIVEGGYYRTIVFDYLNHSKMENYDSKASNY